MKKNFYVKDAVLFGFLGELVDIRTECELASVNFYPGNYPNAEIKWNVQGSNHQIHMIFNSVEEFIVRGRDVAYPVECGTALAIAGFSDGVSYGSDDEFYIEPTQEMSYMSFVMDDRSAIMIKAGSAIMRRI